eukprot:TRINITY_DN253_c0_g2_i2.p1 TRINITY_DN253_c0_g2~~TRINITY_DN253_c0_g2_i2.p1  ORF type:complete len:1002 (-),score=276.19 TRINITY_DN253_c0_g2_i2:89-3094(-)
MELGLPRERQGFHLEREPWLHRLCFSDFGPKFKVLDKDGEPPISNMVIACSINDDGTPVFTTENRHKLSDGDTVLFEEAKDGYECLNGKQCIVKTVKANQFSIDKSEFTTEKPGKVEYYFRAVQQKVPTEIKFRSLMESIPNPVLPGDMMLISDFAAWDRPPHLHFAQIALSLFKDKNSRFPDLKNMEEAQKMYTFAKEIVEKHNTKFIAEGKEAITVEELDEKVLKKAALYSSMELSGFTAYLGGVVAQEIVKFTGKYMPLRQWLHLDCFPLIDDQVIIRKMKKEEIDFQLDRETFEVKEAEEKSDVENGWVCDAINDQVVSREKKDKKEIYDTEMGKEEIKFQFRKPRDDKLGSEPSRYESQIAILGREAHKRLQEWNTFCVGAGALGCEYLKQMALMGIGCADSGKVHVTDMDRIEVSNLNRQFLFRKKDVGTQKSTTAGKAVAAMNPDFSVQSYEVKVCPETEDTFNAAFWDKLDVVVNALDNVKARQYVDRQCVWYEKPLMESGTLGTKANAQVILPHKTESYSDSVDPEEDSIPMCTLRNFPNAIEHCIEWARAEFSDLFSTGAQEVNTYLADTEKFLAELANDSAKEQVEKLAALVDWIKAAQNPSIAECIKIAFNQFHAKFRDKILDLTECFPADARVTDKDSGEDVGPFWSGMRRFPSPISYSAEDAMGVDYVYNAANLYAFGLGLDPVKDRQKIVDISKELKAADWKPKQKDSGGDKKFEQKDEYDPVDDEEALNARAEELKKELSSLPACKPLAIAEFEKDDDTNFHIDFITACSNLRATNYTIENAARHKVKMIAGKIIPALATTTAMITGLVGIELYKLALGLDNLEAYRNAYCNLGVAQVLNQVEPTPPKRAVEGLDPETFMPIKPVPEGFTSWNKIEIKAEGKNLTIGEFNKLLAEKHFGVECNLIGKYGVTKAEIEAGKGMIWTENLGLKKEIQDEMKALLDKPLMDRWKDFYGEPTRDYVVLDIGCETPDGDDAKIPKVKYIYK